MPGGPVTDDVTDEALAAPRDPISTLVRRHASVIAAVTVLLAVTFLVTAPDGWFAAAVLPACPFLAACVVIDAHVHRIPTPLVWTAGGIGLVLLGVAGGATGWPAFGRAVAAGILIGLAFLAKWWLTHGQTGMGDVRLATVLGMYGGFLGWPTALGGVVAAYLLVFPIALYRIVRGVATPIPFGPALVLGWCVAIGWTQFG